MEIWYWRCFDLLFTHRNRNRKKGDPIVSPTIRELAKYTRRGHTSVHVALCHLVDKGWLTKTDDGKFRTIPGRRLA